LGGWFVSGGVEGLVWGGMYEGNSGRRDAQTRCLLYEGAAERIERIEAVSKSSGPRDSMVAWAYRGTSSARAVAIVVSDMVWLLW
jgi:hypothetical protein